MRSIYRFVAACIALTALFVSCIAEPEMAEADITSVRCSISSIDEEEDFATGVINKLPDTRATFSGTSFLWSAGDKIGIVPNTGAQIYFTVDEGAGTSRASFDGGDWAMKSTGTFYAYYPLYPDIFLSKDHVAVSYTGQVQNGNSNNLHAGDFWTLYTEGTSAEGNTLSFTFNHLTSFFKTYVTVPAGTYTKITFSAPSEVFVEDGYFDLSAETPAIVGTTFTNELSLGLQNVTFAEETELTGYLVLAPVDISGIPITVTVYKDDAAAYEYTLTKTDPMVAAKTYAFRATALTQLASSVDQANALFAAGATSVTITAPLTEDATVVLPNTADPVAVTLPTTASSATLTVSYAPAADSYPTSLSISGPEGSDLVIQTPNTTVTVNGVSYNHITSRTAANTCIISEGVTVNVLKVLQGGVQVYGTVTQIDLSEQEDDAIVDVTGTVASLLGEDDEEYTPVSGVSLNQSSISLGVGATATLTATVAPVGAYPKVVWSSSNETVASVSSEGIVTAVAEGSATITARTISGGFTATCVATVAASSTIEGKTYVDLGIRKSHIDSRITPGSKYDRKIVVASCNIGADSPEDFGYYFRWGELNGWRVITDIQHSGDYTYAYITSAVQYDKYGNNLGVWNSNAFDRNSYALSGGTSLEDFKGKTNLQYNGTVYGDAATYNWGGPWVTPDYPTLYALLGKPLGNITTSDGPVDIAVGNDNGTITLTYSYTEQNGVTGLLIENQAISKSIFLPAGGFCLDGQVHNAGSYNDMGEYWCSSKGSYNGTAYYMQYNYNILYLQTQGTFHGAPIRPMAELTLEDAVPEPALPPSVGDVVIQGVDYKKATVQSSLIDDGNALTERGFYYGTSPDALNTKITVKGYDIGEYSRQIGGLNPGATYYIKAYATNEAGTSESNIVSFTTTATSGTINGKEWVDIGIKKSMFDSSIEPGSSADRRIVFAVQNIGASSRYGTGYFFRGNELYGWKYSGSTTSSSDVQITSTNLEQVDSEGNTLHAFDYDNFKWQDEESAPSEFYVGYTSGNAVNYYYGPGWSYMPEQLMDSLNCSSTWYSSLPSTVYATCTFSAELTLSFAFTSSGLSISNSNLGTYVYFPCAGEIYGIYSACYYESGSGLYWGKGSIEADYGGGYKRGWLISKERVGENWDPETENYTSWRYYWKTTGSNTFDSYRGFPVRPVAELPL